MGFGTLCLLILSLVAATVNGNDQGDALNSWKNMLNDPNSVLQSWDPTLINPCTWFHVTCNSDNRVTRLDLGNAGISGKLSPVLANLSSLQYMELFGNNLNGQIPPEFGKLTNLVSLDLYSNNFTGSIPATLGKLKSLRFLRLNGNGLTGDLPVEILELASVKKGSLNILDVSNNFLSGTVPPTKSKGLTITSIVQDPRA